ncbi:hypothetical protein DCC85_13135 [Paenibacillus sp. CAA11]|uniref:hypothetical protein n=1 Tax=Paenibacillus sp. CAA11 TaxID=1532905 RepID=UPI000D37B679|nr:hypothetical protein [Paenibacillus sp. CAA11]AWB45073.1 hypothetical protein DCC85_13135 [Paenibacillus sp. CAA11]
MSHIPLVHTYLAAYDEARSLSLEGIRLFKLGMYSQAAELFLYLADPSAEAANQEGTFKSVAAEAWMNYGYVKKLEHDYKAASQAFRIAARARHLSRTAIYEWAHSLHLSGSPDERIAAELISESSKTESYLPMDWIQEIMFELGAYDFVIRDLHSRGLHHPSWNRMNMLCLIHTGKLTEALESLHVSKDFTPDSLARYEQLLHWSLAPSLRDFPGTLFELDSWMRSAVQLGLLGLADRLSGPPDSELQSLLTVYLYDEGYIRLARQRIQKPTKFDKFAARNQQKSTLGRQRLNFISAELQYDSEDYAQAEHLFHSLADEAPRLAQPRFGAAASQLQQMLLIPRSGQAVNASFLPSHEDLLQSLRILTASKWHTEWTPAQSRNQMKM